MHKIILLLHSYTHTAWTFAFLFHLPNLSQLSTTFVFVVFICKCLIYRFLFHYLLTQTLLTLCHQDQAVCIEQLPKQASAMFFSNNFCDYHTQQRTCTPGPGMCIKLQIPGPGVL